MYLSLTIVRYPKYFIPLALFSMALLRIPLFFTKGLSFWKLVGCGKNGSFDIEPDWVHWGLLAVWDDEKDFVNFQQQSFVQKWWNALTTEQWSLLCIPYASHGKWSGKEPFKTSESYANYQGPVAVLTRATIKLNKLRGFWSHVPAVAESLKRAKGFIISVGIGEVPFLSPATFSIWNSVEDVKHFAYQQQAHKQVIKKTREENWFSEELFARFIPIKSEGTIKGIEPLVNINATV